MLNKIYIKTKDPLDRALELILTVELLLKRSEAGGDREKYRKLILIRRDLRLLVQDLLRMQRGA